LLLLEIPLLSIPGGFGLLLDRTSSHSRRAGRAWAGGIDSGA